MRQKPQECTTKKSQRITQQQKGQCHKHSKIVLVLLRPNPSTVRVNCTLQAKKNTARDKGPTCNWQNGRFLSGILSGSSKCQTWQTFPFTKTQLTAFIITPNNVYLLKSDCGYRITCLLLPWNFCQPGLILQVVFFFLPKLAANVRFPHSGHHTTLNGFVVVWPAPRSVMNAWAQCPPAKAADLWFRRQRNLGRMDWFWSLLF